MHTAKAAKFYDLIKAYWKLPKFSRRLYLVLLVIFIGMVAATLLNGAGHLPAALSTSLPSTPFYAIRLAFTFVLAVEILDLIFAMAESVSLAMAKQLEIMALLLLRESFTDISLLHVDLPGEEEWFVLIQVGVTALSGLLLFVIRGFFLRWHKIQGYSDMVGYVNAKKCISLFLLLLFICIGAYDLFRMATAGEASLFFNMFYTILIFMDILLIIVGQCFTPSFQATFRNSGYAVCTMLMRLAMGAQHHVGAFLCIFAGLYLLGLTWSIARFAPPVKDD
jgi:hypothetical protein